MPGLSDAKERPMLKQWYNPTSFKYTIHNSSPPWDLKRTNIGFGFVDLVCVLGIRGGFISERVSGKTTGAH